MITSVVSQLIVAIAIMLIYVFDVVIVNVIFLKSPRFALVLSAAAILWSVLIQEVQVTRMAVIVAALCWPLFVIFCVDHLQERCRLQAS